MQNVLSSINYLEFINNVNSAINELLYSPDNGYVYQKSKDAIENFEKTIEKFEYKVSKIIKKYNFNDSQKFINFKKNDLIQIMKKHYNEQIPIWANEVFDVLVDNFMFKLSVDKEQPDIIWKHILQAIDWVSSVKSMDDDSKKLLISEIRKEFIENLNLKSSDFIQKNNPEKSNIAEFFRLWNMILENEEEFKNLDFSQFNSKLSNLDIKYFENIKTKLKTYKKTAQIDEINLIKSAIELLQLNDDNLKYEFISKVNDDFLNAIECNKNLLEQDKITIIKRRIALFQDSENKTLDYFKKLIISSNE